MDILIVFHSKDKHILPYCLDGIHKNVNKRNIYIVTNEDLRIDNTVFVNENTYPFQKSDLETYFNQTNQVRIGWYYQQLLKLYSHKVIDNLSENYLIVDSDTVFLRPIKFIDENNIPLYAYGQEYHTPYFEHISKVIPSLEKQDSEKSGICHHMVYNKKYLDEIFVSIENFHHDVFWKIMMKNVNPSDLRYSGMSEYELYFNYMLKHHPNKIKIRSLEWKNSRDLQDLYCENIEQFITDCRNFLDFISIHTYIY